VIVVMAAGGVGVPAVGFGNSVGVVVKEKGGVHDGREVNSEA